MYQGKVRTRVCGLLIEDKKVLLLRHDGIGATGHLWSPPGGGLEFELDAEKTLKKEFLEETNLQIEVGEFLFVNEHMDDRHHAMEVFFKVSRVGGEFSLGKDPELKEQILTDIGFFSIEEIRQLPPQSVHSVFSRIESLEDALELNGYYKFVQL